MVFYNLRLGIGKLKTGLIVLSYDLGRVALHSERVDSTTKIKATNAIHKCLMDTNKEVNLVTSENNQKAFDADKAEAFSEKLLTALNYGSLSLMMSIGHRTGIFDAMRALPPSTSEEVAKASGLNERYVRGKTEGSRLHS